jgi:hypothetical protein
MAEAGSSLTPTGSLYVGYHNDAGEPVVMVDGRELTLPGGAAATPGNFEWGWRGNKPLRLALAILYRETDARKASSYASLFMERVVSTLPREWTLTSASIRESLRGIEADTSHEVG